MNTYDLGIFLMVMAAGTSGLVLFIFACNAILNFLKTVRPIHSLHIRAERNVKRISSPAERRKLETIPTVTCAMPITPQVRVEGRLW